MSFVILNIVRLSEAIGYRRYNYGLKVSIASCVADYFHQIIKCWDNSEYVCGFLKLDIF